MTDEQTRAMEIWQSAYDAWANCDCYAEDHATPDQAAASIIAAALSEKDAEIARLTPYVEAFRREEDRADSLAQTRDEQADRIRELEEALADMVSYARCNERWQDDHPEYVERAEALLTKHEGTDNEHQ